MAKKNYAEMSDHELMVEMLKAQEKDARRGLLAAASGFTIAFIFLVAFIILIPFILTSLNNINNALDNVTLMVENAEVTISQAQTTLEGIDTMTNSVNDVVVGNTQSVSDALDEINSININQLNQAIDDLASIVRPLAQLFGKGD